MDGILLANFLQSVRKDWKLLCHTWFEAHPKLTEHMILVDPGENTSGEDRNKKAMKSCVRWVRRGGVLAVYPAGTVSRFRLRRLAVSDPPWKPGIARLARMTRATIVPVYFSGRNSWWYHLLGVLHPVLAMMRLPGELLKKRGKSLRLRIGRPIPYSVLPQTDNDETITSFLREATYSLAASDI